MLQRGRPHADVLYLTPEGSPHVFQPPPTALRDDPTLGRNAVDELLRYDSPVQLTDRVATVDCGRLSGWSVDVPDRSKLDGQRRRIPAS